MLEEIYLERREEIDKIIKKAIKDIEGKLTQVDCSKINKETYNALEENYNLKLSSVAKELYLQGFKDGINLMLEVKEK
mgnify:FL=1